MKLLDVIVRLHDPARAFELRRAIFALVCQSYRPMAINLVTQRFSETQIKEIKAVLAPTLAIDQSVDFRVLNYSDPEPDDARSALINLGIRVSQGRYLAILDHDDSIFPEAYRELIGELRNTNCAVAFGSIAMKDIDVFQDALLVQRRRATFAGNNLIDLFDDNFCPVHSFLLDRTRVDSEDLWFEETLAKLEDYNFLLRICSRYESSFRLIGKFIGDYYIKNDGTNTLNFDLAEPDDRGPDWLRSDANIQELKATCLLSGAVQRQLGLFPPDPRLTIRRLLDQFLVNGKRANSATRTNSNTVQLQTANPMK